jgi:pimeloyl-ACP methyl ester carboxylesterase
MEHVILVHGLWMRGIAMGSLSRRLQAAGFTTASFEYMSVASGPEPAAERLRERVAKSKKPVHLVGHSLGGLVALEAMRGRDAFPGGRIVCLGSPLKGSRAAQGLARLPFAEALVGKSRMMLGSGIAPWSDAREVGVIAGRVPVGMGMLMPGLPEPHDGTVAVDETQLEGIAAHHVVAATHTGMVFSDEVARLVVAFLRAGRFS